MKLVLKKLPDQVAIEVEVAEDATCEDLKRQIQTDHQFDVSWQKVIFAGRIVSDEARLAEQGIKDGASLVLVTAQRLLPLPHPRLLPPLPLNQLLLSPHLPKHNLLPRPPLLQMLLRLLGMGFEQEQIVRALRLARNDLQNACDLLLSGAQRTDPQQEASNLMSDLIQRMGQQNSDPQAQFEWVVQQPQFQRIRSLLQTRPDLFAALLTQLGGSNPQLHELISQNQAEFLEWLNDEEGGDGDGSDIAVVQTGGGGGGGAAAQLSQRDESSITRLMELGFGRDVVRQAYLACGKNEEMAANYLFENS
ncbi:UBA/TSN domain containing protein [Acanthamoeba castellanii str. Neff]|uniref:UV excision repair protein RAD23 n=1 Tax=Acanthamoeba castellanii (strain ATCC 30010 / Neff) TaxID=1257118 RepID=L8GHN2_ACACF|nr:UBA/TSN domain containing protein [Acanthamoeba castellanii str. Neff]ELR12364.1 UBA/TSN domain containing protein [Acanthamoeba castellanii str. Neff]